MEQPNLERMRRFALVIGLILITYSLAAVELDAGETIHPLGVPLRINRPEYLGAALVIASIWGTLRFVYYGVWRSQSPARKRREELKPSVEMRPAHQQGDVERYLDAIRSYFPRLPGARISAKLAPEFEPGEREERHRERTIESPGDRFFVEPIIPRVFYIAARIEDFDYFAPIWLNGIALALWLYRVTSGSF